MPAGLMAPQSGCQAADQAIRPDMAIQIFLTGMPFLVAVETLDILLGCVALLSLFMGI